MQLDQLIHWRIVGTPDVFTETKDGHEWQVIHSGGAVHQAGFSQIVGFERPIKTVFLSAIASLYTTGGGLMVRLGVEVDGKTDWSGWFGPDNGWPGYPPKLLKHGAYGLNTKVVTAFLESKCRYPVKANTSRWRDVQLEIEYLDEGPEPEPEPEPDPDLPGCPGEIAQMLTEIQERLDRIDGYLKQWGEAQAWVDRYNQNRGD